MREGLSKKKASFGYYLDTHEQPRVSRTDQHYEDNGMQFVWGMEELSIDELNDLFVRVSQQHATLCMSRILDRAELFRVIPFCIALLPAPR